jgi:hypothetical protein
MPKSMFAVKSMGNNKSLKCARVALPECVVRLALYRHGMAVP